MSGIPNYRTKAPRRRRASVDGWVSNAQLSREIEVAHRRWLARRSLESTVIVRRRIGHPKCPKAGAAIAEWKALGCPKAGFREICERHEANYFTALQRRKREAQPKPRRAAA